MEVAVGENASEEARKSAKGGRWRSKRCGISEARRKIGEAELDQVRRHRQTSHDARTFERHRDKPPHRGRREETSRLQKLRGAIRSQTKLAELRLTTIKPEEVRHTDRRCEGVPCIEC